MKWMLLTSTVTAGVFFGTILASRMPDAARTQAACKAACKAAFNARKPIITCLILAGLIGAIGGAMQLVGNAQRQAEIATEAHAEWVETQEASAAALVQRQADLPLCAQMEKALDDANVAYMHLPMITDAMPASVIAQKQAESIAALAKLRRLQVDTSPLAIRCRSYKVPL
jgi:hypothetical protein